MPPQWAAARSCWHPRPGGDRELGQHRQDVVPAVGEGIVPVSGPIAVPVAAVVQGEHPQAGSGQQGAMELPGHRPNAGFIHIPVISEP